MREDVRTGTKPKQNEEQKARDHAANNIARRFRTFAPQTKRMDAEQSERAHHHSRSPEAAVQLIVHPISKQISECACREREKQCETPAKSRHGQAQENRSERHVREQMSEVAMQHHRGEQSKPFALAYCEIVHHPLGADCP